MRLEYQLFCEIRERIGDVLPVLQENSRILAMVDAIASLAQVAYDNNYVRPQINEDGVIRLAESRHPVVENPFGALFQTIAPWMGRITVF